MFRIFSLIIVVNLVFAKDWTHYTKQNEYRDVVRTENGTLWAAFAWGLQERLPNGTENFYMPGNNGLGTADFVQLFALPRGDIIAVSKNGILVRKNSNSMYFQTISNSYVEKNRKVLQGLGEREGNILILPFEGALAFFDYAQNRSVLTISQIKDNSLANFTIKRIAVEKDSIWLDLGNKVWKREIDWNKMADPSFWKESNRELKEKIKPYYVPSNLNFSLERVKTISILPNGDALAWGNEFDYFSRMKNGYWEGPFLANQSGYGDDQKNYFTKSLAVLPNGNFAIGMWGPGLMTYDAANAITGWLHSTQSNDICPTMFKNGVSGYTLIQGVVPAPDYSGYIFSYVSEGKYGLGFVNNSGNAKCSNAAASSPVAFAITARRSITGEWEIYAAWRTALESKNGGVDFYSLSPQNSEDFSPELRKKWPLSFGSPIDFAFDSRGILWAVSSSKIFYLDAVEDEWKEPSYIRGFNNGTISALETDARNGLWVATLGDGAYSFSQINNQPDSITARRFRVREGLLNETVYDIAIDTIKGRVYFAHDLGLSVYSTALVRNTSDYMQSGKKPIAYPNPFRPELHNTMKIDYISENSSVYIFDSSGKRVRFFKGADLQGGVAVWDGRNESGKFVAPGLYYYIASAGKNVAKGKIMVER